MAHHIPVNVAFGVMSFQAFSVLHDCCNDHGLHGVQLSFVRTSLLFHQEDIIIGTFSQNLEQL